MITASYEGICVEFENNQYNISFPTFKLQANINNLLWLAGYILLLTISVYDYYALEAGSVVYISQKAIIS